jgi:nitrogen fixation NifU-like protein
MLSVMVTENGGMKLDDALKISPQEIVKRLGGLPKRKIHCSVLGDKALRAAINDFFKKTKQHERVKIVGAKVVDKILKVTDKDIEEAVLEGAMTFEDVQNKTKVGVHDKSCVPEVKELIEFYKRKYFDLK